MSKRAIFILFLLSALVLVAPQANAQCAMCTANAEMGVKNGNTQTKGLNTGVLYLLAAPFLLAGVVGVVWYTSYRKKTSPSVA